MAFTKDPDALIDYIVEWSEWMPTGDNLVSANTTAQSGITVDSQAVTTASALHTIWLSGGAPGTTYRITSRIYTNGGRRDERSFFVRVRER